MSPGVHDIPFDAYLDADGVSQSQLKLLGRSPAHLKASQDAPREETEAQMLGTLIHGAVFGNALQVHLRPETYEDAKGNEKKWNGNATECKMWLASHRDLPVIKRDQAAMILAVRDAVRAHPAAQLALATGKPEQSLFATDPETGLLLKCRPDWLSGNAIVDLKSVGDFMSDASVEGFAKAVLNYGYDVQAAFYLDICELLNLGKRYFVFIAVEKDPPYAVGVYQLDDESIEIGRRKYRYWLPIYKECLFNGVWPGYSTRIEIISLPDFAKRREAYQRA